MSFRNESLFAVVTSGSTLSGAVTVRGFSLLALHVPACTSGTLAVQGTAVTDPTSADFGGVLAADGSAALSLAVGAGNVVVSLSEPCHALTQLRFSFSAAQSDVRTLTVVGKS